MSRRNVLISATSVLRRFYFTGSRSGAGATTEVRELEKEVKPERIVSPSGRELQFPTNTSIVDFSREAAVPWAEETAFECAITGVKFTHNQIFRLSRRFASALYKAGLRKGDTVAVILPNTPIFPIIFYGILEAGLVANHLSPTLPPARLVHMMKQTNTKALVTFPVMAFEIKGVKDHGLKTVIATDHGLAGCHTFGEMIKSEENPAAFAQGTVVDFDNDLATIFWSSGTTGPPKPVAHSHRAVLRQMLQYVSIAPGIYQPGKETILGVVPMSHGYGSMCCLRLAPLLGAKVVTFPKFSPEVFASSIREYKPTAMFINAQLLNICGSDDRIRPQDMAQVRVATTGGARIVPSVRDTFFSKFGDHIFMQNMFGMTEAGLTHYMPRSHKHVKVDSMGQLLPNTYCKIIDSNGEALGPGQSGEMLLKGPQQMMEYLNRPEATAETMDSDGWVRTGDICRYDEDGFFYIEDRIKDLIKVNGMQVSPSLLEDYLNEHPDIRESAVVGIPDERYGEVPRAFVVATRKDLTVEEVIKFLEPKLTKYEALRGGIKFLDSFPKNVIGKIERTELRKM